MLLGPDGVTPIQSEQATADVNERMQTLLKAVYTVFSTQEPKVNMSEGADVGMTLIMNLIGCHPTPQLCAQQGQMIRDALDAHVRRVLQMKAQSAVPAPQLLQ